MRIIEDVRTATETFPEVALTIGSFDGVHLGHMRVIEQLMESARARRGTAALMTLRPHPRHFFMPDNAPNLLTTDARKEELLEQAGIEVLYVLPFDASTAHLTARAFFEEIVVARCHTRELIVGHDFTFGRGAGGNYACLAQWAPEFGIELREEPPLVIQGERVSSTLIRERILDGEVEHLEHFLGRRYAIRGIVESGRGIGRTLGFPTANLRPHGGALPAQGVYAAQAILRGCPVPAAVNIGIAPTIAHDAVTVEAHLLDFDGPLSGETLDIEFHKRLRTEKKFASREALIEGIARDVAEVRRYFSGV